MTAPRRGRKVMIVRECAMYQDIYGFDRCCFYGLDIGEWPHPSPGYPWEAKMYNNHKTAPSKTHVA